MTWFLVCLVVAIVDCAALVWLLMLATSFTSPAASRDPVWERWRCELDGISYAERHYD